MSETTETIAYEQEQLFPMSLSSVFIAAYLCILVLIGFILSSDQFLHWFIIPLFVCGVLVGTDAVEWFRGRMDIFDPVGILGLIGVHFFFLAPLLHVSWDYWMSDVAPPPDWRDWLGGMAILNAAGLLAYRFSRNVVTYITKRQKNVRGASNKTVWRIDWAIFRPLIIGAMVVSVVLQAYVYARYGGIMGYIDAVTSHVYGEQSAFENTGWLFTFSETFPLLALMAYAVYTKMKGETKSWRLLAFIMLVYFVFQIFFGGLRGSRSNIVWAMFWGIGIVHYWMRPIPKKFVIAGCIFLIVIMYFYGFYKGAGLDSLEILNGGTSQAALEQETDRGMASTLLGDLGRSDVQAYLLYRLSSPYSDYQYSLGRSYVAALALFIPRSVWADRPPLVSMEGTQAQFGMGSYIPGVWESSKVYGLAGEAMLNFGPFAIPFAYFLLGLFVSWVRQFMVSLDPGDSRLLLFPFLVNTCFIILVGDLDNILFDFIKGITMPLLVIFLSSSKLAELRYIKNIIVPVRIR